MEIIRGEGGVEREGEIGGEAGGRGGGMRRGREGIRNGTRSQTFLEQFSLCISQIHRWALLTRNLTS